jgi:hypothetical protein
VQTKAPGGNNSSSFSMESGACSRDSESDTSSRDSESGTNTFDAMLLTSMRRRTVSPATFSLATARRSASRNGDRAASKQPRRPANVASLPMSISMDSGFFSMDSGGGEVQAVARCRCGGEQVQAPQSAGEATSGRAGAAGVATRGRGGEQASKLSPGACRRGGERAPSWFSGVVAWDTKQCINSWASMEKTTSQRTTTAFAHSVLWPERLDFTYRWEYYVENSYPYPTSTLSPNRLVTLPPGLYKARQGPLSLIYASSCKLIQSIQSYAAYRT